jgi:hypothetical protein
VRGASLSLNEHVAGYRLVHLYGEDGRTVRSVHGLVAESFIGPRPAGKQVCHGDGNRANNVLGNLRYDTPVGNNADKKKHGTLLFGEQAPLVILTESDVREIRRLRGVPQQDLADRYGVTFSNISAVQLRKSWRHVA